MKDVPSNCLVAGNPARIMEKGIRTGARGIIDRTVRPDFGAAQSAPDETAPEKAAS
jgi:serine acetyltransferase